MQNKLNIPYAIKTALAGTTTAAIFIWSHMKNGHWAAITTIITMQSYVGTKSFMNTLIAGRNAIIGALLGLSLGVTGFHLMNAVASDGYLWFIFFVIFFILTICVTISQKYRTLSLTPTCAIMIMYLGLTDSVSKGMYERAIEIFVGVLVAVTFNLMVLPSKNHKKLNLLILHVIKMTQDYLAHSVSSINSSNIAKKTLKKDINTSFQQFKDIRQQSVHPFYNKDKKVYYELLEKEVSKLIDFAYQINKTVASMDINYIDERNLAIFKHELENINSSLSDFKKSNNTDDEASLITKVEHNFVDYSRPEQNTAQMMLANSIYELKKIINEITRIFAENK